MSFHDLAQKRFSVRAYDPHRTVPAALVNEILETVRLAPSAANRQPWKILLVESAQRRQALAEAYPKDWLKDAPLVAVFVGLRTETWKRSDGYQTLETDLAILATHFVLAAADVGLGTCWIANFQPDILRKALELGDNEEVFAISPLGYPAEGTVAAPKARRPLAEVATRV